MQLNQNQEIFRAVDGYLNYEISNHGRVRNAKSGKIIRQGKTNGYPKVVLYENCKGKNFKVHRLVCMTFLENPNNYDTVDHIDRNKENNHYLNLRWASKEIQERNKGINKNNISEVKGVSFNNTQKCWLAQIFKGDGVRITKSFSIGKHPNAKELATQWRKEKEIQFGYQQ